MRGKLHGKEEVNAALVLALSNPIPGGAAPRQHCVRRNADGGEGRRRARTGRSDQRRIEELTRGSDARKGSLTKKESETWR